MSELISIIVPVYNVEKYIVRCIDSIIGQTYKNLQIILVNDGSPDGSPAICDEYARRDSRIEVIHKQNGGLSDARNAGIECAKGEYIAFVDSDDYVHQLYIENMYNCIKHDNSDMCVCDFHFVNEGEEAFDLTLKKPERSAFHLEGLYPAETAMKNIFNSYLVVAWNKLYRRDIFDNIKFPVGRIHEDEFVLHRIFAACSSVSILPERLYYYLQRSESITNKPYSVRRLDALDAFDDRLHFYLENKRYSLLKLTCLHYIRWYIKMHNLLPRNIEENRVRWKECSAQFRAHCRTMFKYGGFIIGLRFLLAILTPGIYRAVSGKINSGEK